MSRTVGINPSVYEPGQSISGQATAAVTGKRFLAITGDRPAGAGVVTPHTGGPIAVGHATAAGRVCGVAAHDAGSGELVRVLRGAGRVVKVTASGAISAFAEVQVAADGKAAAKSAGVAVGYVLTAAVDGGDAEVSLYA
ncbi:DUF2190 family protein [Mycobacterium paraintracellulare]